MKDLETFKEKLQDERTICEETMQRKNQTKRKNLTIYL